MYNSLCPARQTLVTPTLLTDEQYLAEWKNITWQGLPFSPDAPQYDTANGEKVRSKSEVIIADTLARYGIAYRYEFPLRLRQTKRDSENATIYPDFLCLNLRTRTEFYWEHFGLMDDAAYATKSARKLRLYAENNIFIGRNLIITMETQEEPLNIKIIEKSIIEFLK